MHPQITVDTARRLSQLDVLDREVAQITGVSMSAVRRWRTGTRRAPGKERKPDCPRCTGRPLDEAACAYLLGLYLGDGCLTHGRRDVFALCIACSDAWPGLLAAAKSAMSVVMSASGVVAVQRAGYRGSNRVRRNWGGGDHWYEYPRYLFTNNSVDILRLCGQTLDQLGVAWRFSKPNTISVARREAVARLDEFVGPKY